MRKKSYFESLRYISALLIMLVTSTVYSQAQQRTITGIITDGNTKDAVPGVSIYIQGTTTGTISDIDGKYSIKSSNETDKLVFSYIGYVTQTITVGSQATINVSFVPDFKDISEVVVIGYGSVKKSDLTGSVSTVSTKDLNKNAVISFEKALQGNVAGVVVSQNNGSPGSSVTVRIRGVGTILDSDPLYVVDGFPASSITNLNTSDIESMSILKDASATAIYGARAANGVVMITTRKGSAGKTIVEYNTYVGIQSPVNLLKMANRDEFCSILTTKLLEEKNGDSTKVFKGANRILRNPSILPNTNWQKEIYRNDAMMQNHQLSISGGSNTTNFYASLGYIKQDGLIQGSGYEKINFRADVQHSTGKRLTVGLNSSFSNSNRDIIKEDNIDGVVLSSYLFEPIITPRDTLGHPSTSLFNQTYSNPLLQQEFFSFNSKNFDFINNLFAEFEIFKGLKFRTSGGLDFTFTNDTRVTKYFPWAFPTKLSQLDNTTSINKNWLWENTFNYSFSNPIHSINLVAGATAQATRYQYLSGTGYDLPDNTPQNQYLVVGQKTTSTGSASEYRINSYLARLNYGLLDKYLVTVSLRSDASSRFGPEKRTGYFPAVAFAYKISNESFLKDNKIINSLKFRGGWGKIGNDRINDFSYTSLVWGHRNYVLGKTPTMVLGNTPISAANKAVKWEASVQSNIGFDLNLLNNKLTLTTDYYNRTTEDLLLPVQVPGSVGLERKPTLNAGDISNKGWEFVLSYKNYDNAFTYEFGANLSTQKNNVENLANNYFPDGPGISTSSQAAFNRTEAGHPIGAFYGYQVAGIYQQDEKLVQKDALPGDFKYKDLDGNDTINEKDMTYLGSPFPSITYGATINLGFKGIDFSAQFQGVHGNKVVNAVKFFTYQVAGGRNIEEAAANVKDHWTPMNTGARLPDLRSKSYGDISDFYVEDGSYLRLKNIQIGYTLPAKFTGKAGISKLRFYLAAQNLYTWTKYSGVDPEIGKGNEGAIDYAIDRGQYPPAKVFMIGASLTF